MEGVDLGADRGTVALLSSCEGVRSAGGSSQCGAHGVVDGTATERRVTGLSAWCLMLDASGVLIMRCRAWAQGLMAKGSCELPVLICCVCKVLGAGCFKYVCSYLWYCMGMGDSLGPHQHHCGSAGTRHGNPLESCACLIPTRNGIWCFDFKQGAPGVSRGGVCNSPDW